RDELTELRDTANRLFAAWRATGPVLRDKEAAAEAKRLRVVMAAEQERARPALRARALAAAPLSLALNPGGAEAAAASVAAAERAEGREAQVAAERSEQLRLTGDAAGHRAQAKQAEKALAEIAALHGQAIREGVIGTDDDVGSTAAQARSAQG